MELFDIAIWCCDIELHVSALLGLIWKSRAPIFVWKNKNCKVRNITNPYCVTRHWVRKDLGFIWSHPSHSANYNVTNTLLVDVLPHQVCKNLSTNVILPPPYSMTTSSHKSKDGFLLGQLWPWLLCLSKARIWLVYMAMCLFPHGQHPWRDRDNPTIN